MADMISTLPDELLCNILSFLPTQDAIVTSMLSKRWMPLWHSVPELWFDDETYFTNNNKPHCFQKFIYAAILARDAHKPIRSFCLQFGYNLELSDSEHKFKLSDSDLNIWVNAAVQRGLENLHIDLPGHATLRSRHIFNCKTLVVLELLGLQVGAFSIVDLPSLKTLHLTKMCFPERQYLVELLYGCPNLEYLTLRDIGFDDFSSPSHRKFKTLSKLVWAHIDTFNFDIPLKAIGNVAFLGIRILEGLDNNIPVFPNLTHVELNFVLYRSWDPVLVMFKQCPKLQSCVLDLSEGFHVDWLAPHFVPECLYSQLRKCSIINFFDEKSGRDFVKYVLQSSRVLRMMTIYTQPSMGSKRKRELLKELSLSPRSSTICELLVE